MYSFKILLVSSTLILFSLYRITREWDKPTCFSDLLCLNLNEVESVLSHIEQKKSPHLF